MTTIPFYSRIGTFSFLAVEAPAIEEAQRVQLQQQRRILFASNREREQRLLTRIHVLENLRAALQDPLGQEAQVISMQIGSLRETLAPISTRIARLVVLLNGS